MSLLLNFPSFEADAVQGSLHGKAFVWVPRHRKRHPAFGLRAWDATALPRLPACCRVSPTSFNGVPVPYQARPGSYLRSQPQRWGVSGSFLPAASGTALGPAAWATRVIANRNSHQATHAAASLAEHCGRLEAAQDSASAHSCPLPREPSLTGGHGVQEGQAATREKSTQGRRETGNGRIY